MIPTLPPLFQRQGPLTEETLLAPAKFGLGMAPVDLQGDAVAGSVCGFCSTGCNLNVHLRDGAAVGLTPAADYPVNLGMACPKGWEALAVLDAPDRAVTPLLRNAAGRLEPVSWDAALRTFVDRMKAIQAAHGPHSVAFLSTGQIVTEEMALLGALAKFGMGMLHGDGNTRQCMAASVVAYKQAFGFDAPPYTYADFEESDVIVLVGSNLCIAHPILWQRVMRNPHRPQIVAIDPRATETTMTATQHLAVYPKSDLALLYGVARILITRGWIDREFIDAHTSGFDEFAAFVESYTPQRVAEETRLPVESIERLAATIHQGERVSFWWTMGVNQSHQAVRTAQAIINLALMTGNIGRPGTGANSITGQCNAMGSRLFSNTTNLLGGHDFGDAAHRRKVADVLAVDEAVIPCEASWPYHRIMEGVLRGEIHGLWVVATNPAHSWINQGLARDVLDRLDFLVVQDMYHSTETARHAHLVLPAAGWGEKDGTFINSERRIGLTTKVRRAPGQALADFHIFKLVADAWGCGEMFRRWESPATVFELLKQLSAGQPCDITGVEGYDMLANRETLGDRFNSMAAQLQDSYATLEHKVQERTHQLELANLAKSRFLAAASHDLRQPLHALNLFADQLRPEDEQGEQERLASQVRNSVAAMNELFNALLDISKLDAGALLPVASEFPVAPLLRRIEAAFLAPAREKGLRLRVILSEGWVRSDAILLERILINLVSNAVRYSERGRIVVGCRRRHDQLRIEVVDSGIGIAEDQQAAIFGEFYRLARPNQAPTGGLGLGLAIVDRLCRLLGHTIEVKSKVDQGSRFAVCVPAVAIRPEIPRPLPLPPALVDPARDKLVVVIDDDPLVLDGMRGLLQSWGCNVVAAVSDSAALSSLANVAEPPDLIISDYHMPGGGTGFEAIERLRATFGASIPAFLITGDTAPERLQDANARGYELLHKPVLPITLRAVVTQLLKGGDGSSSDCGELATDGRQHEAIPSSTLPPQ